MAWDRDEMDTVIENYVEENGSLTKIELQSPQTNLPSYTTVRDTYGGVTDCIEELDLDVETRFGRDGYSRNELLEAIEENSSGVDAPKGNELMISTSGSSPFGRVFGGYLNAVFMAGKEPVEGWYRDSKDHSEEITADYIHITRENYWHNDPEDRWNTEPVGSGKFLNPTQEDLPSHIRNKNIDDLEIPNLGFKGGINGGIHIKEQEEAMNIVEKSTSYLDLIDRIEDTNITERKIRRLLDPESESSYGRWMAETEFPENSMPMLRTRL